MIDKLNELFELVNKADEIKSVLDIKAKEIADVLSSLDYDKYPLQSNYEDIDYNSSYVMIKSWGYCYGQLDEYMNFPIEYMSMTIDDIKIEENKRIADVNDKKELKKKQLEEEKLESDRILFEKLKQKFETKNN